LHLTAEYAEGSLRDAEDIEELEALIKAAYGDACKKLESQAPKLGGGMPDLSMLGF
jgi:DNA-binding protein YbaB